MDYVLLIAVLAIIQFMIFGIFVGRAREKYGVKAPATSGNEHFERALRVQMNTLEQLVCFLPALYLAAPFWPQLYVAGLGVVYLVGRQLYQRAYVTDPAKRGLGFILSVVPTFLLLLGSLVGAVMSAAA